MWLHIQNMWLHTKDHQQKTTEKTPCPSSNCESTVPDTTKQKIHMVIQSVHFSFLYKIR